MEKKIKYAHSNLPEDKNNDIKKCDDLDRSEYETKYKGKRTCYKGCKARIKFTERKSGVKFFSTWNKEGNLHEKGCPYHVDYKGSIGRKKLISFYEKESLDDDTILKRLQDKNRSLQNTYNSSDIQDPINGSRKVKNVGSREVSSKKIDDNVDENVGGKGHNIHYQDANYTTVDDIGCRLSIYGYINNVQLCEDKFSNTYAYFNLKTDDTAVSILFSEAFYSNEFISEVDEFKRFINKVNKIVCDHPNKVFVIAYGDITKKNKLGVNVSVISPKRILVDNKMYLQIINE